MRLCVAESLSVLADCTYYLGMCKGGSLVRKAIDDLMMAPHAEIIPALRPALEALCGEQEPPELRIAGAWAVYRIALFAESEDLQPPHLESLVRILTPLILETEKKDDGVMGEASMAVAALAEATADPHQFHICAPLLPPLRRAMMQSGGRLLAEISTCIAAFIPLMDVADAGVYAEELLARADSLLAWPDDDEVGKEMKLAVLRIIKRCAPLESSHVDAQLTRLYPLFFKTFCDRDAGLGHGYHSLLVEATDVISKRQAMPAEKVEPTSSGCKDSSE